MKKFVSFYLLFATIILGFFLSVIAINYKSRNEYQLIYQEQYVEQLPKLRQSPPMESEIAVVATSEIDWSGFNQDDQELPVWHGTIASNPNYVLDNYDFWLVLYDGNTSGLPNGTIASGDQFWSDLYFAANIIVDQNNTIGAHDEWIMQNEFDWNKRDQKLEMGLVITDLNNYHVYLSKLDQNNTALDLEFFIAPNVDYDYHYEFIAPEINNILIETLNSDFKIVVDFNLNDGPGNFEIKANNISVYHESLADGMTTITYRPPIEYNDYTFDFYLNGNLIIDASQTLKSGFTKARVTQANAYQVKPNFQPNSQTIAANGIIGASVTIANPSNIAITNVEFTLKDADNKILGHKIGMQNASDINTYNVSFDQIGLAAGTFIIDYIVNFNTNQNTLHQDPLTDSLNAIINQQLVTDPQLNFNSIEVNVHPFFEDKISNWNNGVANVNYTLNEVDPNNSIQSATYELYQEKMVEPIANGNLLKGSNTLTFANLTTGSYYIKWNLTWVINSDPQVHSASDQTVSVLLQDINLSSPKLKTLDLHTTEWYSDSKKGTMQGYIQLENFQNAINKTLLITVKFANKIETTKAFIIPSDGIIAINDWILASHGEYQLEFVIQDYQINSKQEEVDYLISNSETIFISQHIFAAPDIEASATYNADHTKIFVTFHSLNGTPDQPWLDVENFQAIVEIDYVNKIRQIITFDETWASAKWNNLFAQVTFDFDLNNNAGIEVIRIYGQFSNPYMAAEKNIDVTRSVESQIPINQKDSDIFKNDGVIAGIVLGSLLLGGLAIGLPTTLVILNKRKGKIL